MTIQSAMTLANIAARAARITEDYHCTILPDYVTVTRNDDPKRHYQVKDGICNCPAYDKNRTCKHLLGLPDLINAELIRLGELANVLEDKTNCFTGIQNGRELLDAHLCEMDVQTYRANITRSMDFV